MSPELRILLILVAFLTFIYIAVKVRKSQMRLDDSVFWFCLALVFLLCALFPYPVIAVAKFCGVESPVHFIFLVFIFVLFIQVFHLTARNSQTDNRVKELTQQLAVEKFERYQNDKREAGKTAQVAQACATQAEDAAPTQSKSGEGPSGE